MAHFGHREFLMSEDPFKVPQFTEDKQENGKLTDAFRKFRVDEELTESEK